MKNQIFLYILLFTLISSYGISQNSFLKYLDHNDTLQYEFLDLELDTERNELHVMLEVGNGSTGFIYLYKISHNGEVLDSIIIAPEFGFFSLDNQSRLVIHKDSLFYGGDYLGSEQRQFLLSVPLDYSDHRLTTIIEEGNFIFNKALAVLISDSTKYVFSRKQKPNFDLVTAIKKLDQAYSSVWENFIIPPNTQNSRFTSAHFDDEGQLIVGHNISINSGTENAINTSNYYMLDSIGNISEYLYLDLLPLEQVSSNIIKINEGSNSKYIAGVREFKYDGPQTYPKLPRIVTLNESGEVIQRFDLSPQNYYINGIEEINQSPYGLTLAGQVYIESPVQTIKPIVCQMTSDLDTAWCKEYILSPETLDIPDKVYISGLDVFEDGSIVIGGDYQSTADNISRPFILKLDANGCFYDDCPEVSSITAVVPAATQILLSPNPTSSVLQIQLSNQTSKHLDLSISNSYGVTILEKNNFDFQDTQSIDISTLPSGIYFLSVYGQHTDRITKRFVVSH